MTKRSFSRLAALTLTAVLLLGAVLAGSIGWWPVAKDAQAQSSAPNVPGTITVVGEGKVSIEPDTAQANFGVEVVGPSVREALDENDATMQKVLAALRDQRIEEKDIQTTGFSIYAERYGPQGPLPEDQVNYRVSNNVMVTIRDLANVGTVVDAAVEAGANNIYGITFRVDDPSPLESDARQNAITKAHAKAEELAALTGVKLGEVVSVSEVIASGGVYSSNFAQSRDAGGGGVTPVMPGQLELLMQLQVTYAIAE